MKSSDVIKKGLWHCSEDGCKKCPYEDDCNMADGFSVLAYDALTLIKQYESDLINLQRLFATAESRANLLEAERDAAVENIRGDCVYCLYLCEDMVAPSCFDCANKGYYRWQWRGVQKEDGNAKSP